jgi:hypothetical protein
MPRNQDKRIRESHALQVRRPRRGPVATTPPTETSAIATRTIGRQRAGNHPELQAIDLRRPRAQLHSVDQEACRGRRPLDGVVMEIGRRPAIAMIRAMTRFENSVFPWFDLPRSRNAPA